jgi:hypothetical protein
MRGFPCLPLVLALGLAACSGEHLHPASIVVNPAKAGDLPYPDVDPSLGENLYPDEKALASQIADSIEKSIRAKYATGLAHRDVHTKAHGCVLAQFRISDELPRNLAQGIFIPGNSYRAWIRFSNGAQDVSQADSKGDARGMAIKVMGIPGEKMLENEREATTQDFVLINHPVFFANNPQSYLSLLEKTSSTSYLDKLTIPFALGLKGSLIAWETGRSTIANPLETRYWSMVPYQLGLDAEHQAVKYSVKPCTTGSDSIPHNPGADYLRDALRTSLQAGDACMMFLVQPRTSSRMNVEDSMTEWKESAAPFYQVATITIPRQRFDTPEQNTFCENLSFTPWHSLPEHRPLGVTNRLRKIVYDRISQVRHDMNGVPRQEP